MNLKKKKGHSLATVFARLSRSPCFSHRAIQPSLRRPLRHWRLHCPQWVAPAQTNSAHTHNIRMSFLKRCHSSFPQKFKSIHLKTSHFQCSPRSSTFFTWLAPTCGWHAFVTILEGVPGTRQYALSLACGAHSGSPNVENSVPTYTG